MASKRTKSWEVIRGQKLLNDDRVATYERLMDAEERIAQARSRRGESEADDLYLGTLARYVAALGGHLEVLAVFPDETITVRREPDGPSTSGEA